MKLSWIYLSGDLEFIGQMREALDIVLDTYLSVNTPAQMGLEKLLETSFGIQTKIKTRIKENCNAIVRLLNGSKSIEYFLPDGGWYIILRLANDCDDEDFACNLLRKKSVYVHPGFMFDMPNSCHIVISLIVPTQIIEQGIKRMIEFVREANQGKSLWIN